MDTNITVGRYVNSSGNDRTQIMLPTAVAKLFAEGNEDVTAIIRAQVAAKVAEAAPEAGKAKTVKAATKAAPKKAAVVDLDAVLTNLP